MQSEQQFLTLVDLSTDAKTLYGILLDRMGLSVKNGWLDEQGRVYIIFPVQEVMDALGCADNKATKLFRELEKFGLIERKRRGLGKPNLIYVKNFADPRFRNRGKNDSGNADSGEQDAAKQRRNKTEWNNTEMSETDPFLSEEGDGADERTRLEAYFMQSLEMQKQICTIHADVELPAGKLNDSGSAEQKLHVLLYKSTLPENDLNRALDELRTERRRQKAEYQGAPFADVFLVNLILSDEDSERACIVDVGDTGMSYVIPWSSIPQELQQPLRRYVAQADGKLCGYCKEDLCNTENGRMIVELYLGKQEHHVSRILY